MVRFLNGTPDVAGTSSIGVIGMISRVKDGITDDPLTSEDVFYLDPRCSTSIAGR